MDRTESHSLPLSRLETLIKMVGSKAPPLPLPPPLPPHLHRLCGALKGEEAGEEGGVVGEAVGAEEGALQLREGAQVDDLSVQRDRGGLDCPAAARQGGGVTDKLTWNVAT